MIFQESLLSLFIIIIIYVFYNLIKIQYLLSIISGKELRVFTFCAIPMCIKELPKNSNIATKILQFTIDDRVKGNFFPMIKLLERVFRSNL